MSAGLFLRVRWTSHDPDDPVLLWSHVVDGWEVRKVDEYDDGRLVWADSDHAAGSTILSQTPIPPPAEIAIDPQFVVEIIDEAAFDFVWSQARGDV